MAREIKITVSDEITSLIQRLSFEMNSRSRIISKLIEDHANDPDASVLESPVFKAYHKELVETESEFELGKAELEKRYIFPDYPNCRWTLDYATSVITVVVDDDESK